MANQEAHNAITSTSTATINSITFADAKNEIKLKQQMALSLAKTQHQT